MHQVFIVSILALLLLNNTYIALQQDHSIIISMFIGFHITSTIVSFIHWFLDTWTTQNSSARIRLFNQAKTHHYHPTLVIMKDLFARNDDAIYGSILFGLILYHGHNYMSSYGIMLWYSMSISVLFSLEIHRYAHMNISEVPYILRLIQMSGLLLSRESHHRHHNGNFNRSYNLMSGLMNRVEDFTGVYPFMESVIRRYTGALPRSYLTDPLQRKELDDYYASHSVS